MPRRAVRAVAWALTLAVTSCGPSGHPAESGAPPIDDAVDAPVEGLTVSWGRPLAGPKGATIPAANVTIHAERYVDVRIPRTSRGLRAPGPTVPTVDTLVGEPRDAFPIDVPAGENRVAWIDVLVPPDATPGVYRGSVWSAPKGVPRACRCSSPCSRSPFRRPPA